MRLLPTSLGVKGALFFATVWLLYLATPYSNLFFLLTAFLAVLGIVGVAGAFANLRGVDVTIVRIEAGPADGGHAAQLQATVAAGRRAFGVSAWLEIGGECRHLADLPDLHGCTTAVGDLQGLPRGVHRVDAVRLRSRHPLGICRVERRLPIAAGTPVEVIAHPRPLDLAAGTDVGDALADQAARALAAHDETVAALRDWRAGDSLRFVHWRATARRGAPIVKEFEHDVGSGLDLVVDRRGDAAAFEHRLAAATALVLAAVQRQQPLRLRSQGCDLAHTVDRPQGAAMLRWLAAAAALPADAPPPPPAASTALRLAANGGGP